MPRKIVFGEDFNCLTLTKFVKVVSVETVVEVVCPSVIIEMQLLPEIGSVISMKAEWESLRFKVGGLKGSTSPMLEIKSSISL